MNIKKKNNEVNQLIFKSKFIQKGTIEEHIKYKKGVSAIKLLEETNLNELSNLEKSRFLYLKNLCLNDPMPFDVTNETGPFEKILMYASFYGFEECQIIFERELHLSYEINFIGTSAKNSVGVESLITVVDINTKNEKIEYIDDDYTSVDYKVSKFDEPTLLYLYIYGLKIAHYEENEEKRKTHIHAICKMGFFQNNDMFNHAFEYLYLKYCKKKFSSSDKLSLITNNIEYPYSLMYPIILQCDFDYYNAQYKISLFRHGEAYDILKEYPFRSERIQCLLMMGDINRSRDEICSYIEFIGKPTSIIHKRKLSNLYIKLGHINQDTNMYDQAYEILNDYPSLKAKALYYYSHKEFKLAIDTFKRALKIAPYNLEMRIYLGCALIELEMYGEALEIFKLLKSEEPTHTGISKNLSLCYLMIDDVKSSLQSIKDVAQGDIANMKYFLMLAIKNRLKDEIEWALKRIYYDSSVEDMILFVIQENLIKKENLKEILLANPHVSIDSIDHLMQNYQNKI